MRSGQRLDEAIRACEADSVVLYDPAAEWAVQAEVGDIAYWSDMDEDERLRISGYAAWVNGG